MTEQHFIQLLANTSEPRDIATILYLKEKHDGASQATQKLIDQSFGIEEIEDLVGRMAAEIDRLSKLLEEKQSS